MPSALKDIPPALVVVMAVLVAANLSNLWRTELLPFTDLPLHLAEATVLKLTWLNDQTIAPYFTARADLLILPNIGHAVFCALFDDVELGNRIAYSLYAISLPFMVLSLIRLVKGNDWFALLAVPLIFNYNTMWGFTGFTLAIPLALAIYRMNYSYLREPSQLKAGLLSILALAVYYTHVLVFLFIVPLCVLSALDAVRGGLTGGGYRRLLYLASFAPAVLVMLLWVWTGPEFDTGQSLAAFLTSYYGSEYLASAPARFSNFFLKDHVWLAWGGWGGIEWGRSVALLYSLPVTVPVALYLRPGSFGRSSAFGERRAAALFTGFAALCYLLLPNRLPEQFLIFQRFSVFIFIGLICCGSFIVPDRVRRQAAALIAVVFTVLAFQYFSGYREWAYGIQWVLKGQDNGRTLAAIIDDRDYRDSPSIIHYNNYHIVWNKGVAASLMVDARFGMVRRRAGTGDIPEYESWIRRDTDYGELLSRYSGMDLLLTHGAGPFDVTSGSDEWRLIRRRNKWAIFERLKGPG